MKFHEEILIYDKSISCQPVADDYDKDLYFHMAALVGDCTGTSEQFEDMFT
jgi:hypothetical protein